MNHRGFTRLEIAKSHGQDNMDAKNPKQRKSLTGFTLIEVLTALFVLTMGVVAVTALLTHTASSTAGVHSNLTASFLAQEGLEIARNTRDTNFLKIRKGLPPVPLWDDGLAIGVPPPAPFGRTITVTELSPGILLVSAKVAWTEKGAPKSVTASTYLTNWLNPSP